MKTAENLCLGFGCWGKGILQRSPSTHLSTFQCQAAYLQANKKAQHFVVLFLDEPTLLVFLRTKVVQSFQLGNGCCQCFVRFGQ